MQRQSIVSEQFRCKVSASHDRPHHTTIACLPTGSPPAGGVDLDCKTGLGYVVAHSWRANDEHRRACAHRPEHQGRGRGRARVHRPDGLRCVPHDDDADRRGESASLSSRWFPMPRRSRRSRLPGPAIWSPWAVSTICCPIRMRTIRRTAGSTPNAFGDDGGIHSWLTAVRPGRVPNSLRQRPKTEEALACGDAG